ncbi:isopenicillin N synthase family oxygenase [Streptomyces inhibens]|uniref:Isopenicillin N synthase family oxygenase n=1 Tax=Streptomyces inhibens TaxID=2293571 RepID=A0A371Q487_STRIH|nr:2-oxoglutarate and iron-dependent oxygenase domain-containing protein [Streptomyces inhibens]REK89481.1 isopenicillin N synthase family oxygenase [Streptomyces inhibens]
MASTRIPVIDLSHWYPNDSASRNHLAANVDQALKSTGFLLVTGHGITPGLAGQVRAAAYDFFHLPPAVKERYAQDTGRRGWIGRERVATARSEGSHTPPDLLEVWSCGAGSTTHPGRTQRLPSRWPDEVPSLHALVTEYTEQMRRLADTVLEVMATALDRPTDFFTRHTACPQWDFTINWYPAASETGPAAPGQFRIGPHTDFGLITLLDRQRGQGGLQVHDDEDGWHDAPYEPGAVTLNIGDLMARWSGDRWRSGRHRVLPPPPDAPGEELTSLVYFHSCAPDTRITSLSAPIGRRSYSPVRAGDYLHDKMQAIYTTG